MSLLSRLSNAQKEIEYKAQCLLTNDEEESKNLNSKALDFSNFLRKHIHGMELTAVPKFAYDIIHNNSNINELLKKFLFKQISNNIPRRNNCRNGRFLYIIK